MAKMKFSWRPSWICAKKTNFACLDFSRLLVCYSRTPSGLKTIEKPSVPICGGSFSILTGLLLTSQTALITAILH